MEHQLVHIIQQHQIHLKLVLMIFTLEICMVLFITMIKLLFQRHGLQMNMILNMNWVGEVYHQNLYLQLMMNGFKCQTQPERVTHLVVGQFRE